MLSSVSFISVLQFLQPRYLDSSGRFIPRYFIIFDMTVNEIIPLFTFLILYCEYIEMQQIALWEFFILSLHQMTLPNLLMSSSSFLVASLRFSMYNIMLCANMIILLLPFKFIFLLFLFHL